MSPREAIAAFFEVFLHAITFGVDKGSSHPTTSTLSSSRLQGIKHSKHVEVVLLDVPDCITFSKYDEYGSQIMLKCSSLALSQLPHSAAFRTFLIVIYFRPSKYNPNKYVILLS